MARRSVQDRAPAASRANAWAVLAVIGLALTACSGPDAAVPGNDCVPTAEVADQPLRDPDRRIEDIIEYLTGERQTGDLDPVETTIDDPNFGGVWGDFSGGVVVAVLDCSLVDADELAAMAGGSGRLHVIEVPYTFRQVNAFRDELVSELRTLGVEGDVSIDSTLTGRFIEVRVRDAGDLPESFGSGVPGVLFAVVEGAVSGEE